jgi:hypothetical protein
MPRSLLSGSQRPYYTRVAKDLHAHVRTYIYARDCLGVGTDASGESDARTG